MKWRVVSTARATNDAREAADWIAIDSHRASEIWLDGLERAIATLETMPRRYRRAPESRVFGGEVRQLLYHSHRVIYSVGKTEVQVLHIRHAAMRPLRKTD